MRDVKDKYTPACAPSLRRVLRQGVLPPPGGPALLGVLVRSQPLPAASPPPYEQRRRLQPRLSTKQATMSWLRTFTGARDERGARALVAIYANIVIYALCYWMNMPVMPFLSKCVLSRSVQGALFWLSHSSHPP